VSATAVLTLDELIERLISVGLKDPLEIARKAIKEQGEDWILAQLAERSEDIVAEFARHRLGSHRRSHEIVRLDRAQEPEFMLQAKWVPEVGWKRIGDLTADDCELIASHYESLSRATAIRAQLFRQFAQLIRTENVATLGGVSVQLPQLVLEEAV
jgi:hypothetical protein